MKQMGSDFLPVESLLSDLSAMRRTVHVLFDAQRRRMDDEMDVLAARISKMANAKTVPEGCRQDARDMLAMLRGIDVNPSNAKTKDLKKLQGVLGDLLMLTEKW